MRCSICTCDLDKEGMDNLSPISGFPVCEICAAGMDEKDWKFFAEYVEEDGEEDE